jgi:DNA-binding response OmpR family regulator
MKVLLVDDDVNVSSTLAEALAEYNYVVTTAKDGQIGLEFARDFDFDLILLDIGIPKIDGISLCRQLREIGTKTPILLLTGKQSNTDKIIGLDAGADDYMVKPFDLPELLARVRALVRRGGASSPATLTWGELQFDPSTCEVTCDREILHLTPKESSILELLLRNPQRIFSRGLILDRLWSFAESPGEETVTTHIKGLRHKLKSFGMQSDPIETIYGLGYRLRSVSTLETSSKSHSRSTSLPTSATNRQNSTQQFTDTIIDLWQKFQQNSQSTIALFRDAQKAMATNQLHAPVWLQAKEEAHRLIGSFGVFGITKCSDLARQIEGLLATETDSLDLPKASKALKAKAQNLTKLITDLQQEIAHSEPTLPEEPINPSDRQINHTGTHLLIIDDNQVLAERIEIEAIAQGFSVQLATDLAIARRAIATKTPQAILLDLSFPNTLETGLTLLAEIIAQTPQIPVLVFTSSDRLGDRVEAARLGAKIFLQKPIATAQVLQAVIQALKRTDTCGAKVLAVDDDPYILYAIADLLEPWGLQVTGLEQPQQFLQVLNATIPDLLIIDLEMPDFSGIDLCHVVRNDLYWGNLPILVLTASKDAETISQVFAAGADDFVSKPLLGPELVTRTISRIERQKIFRSS